MDKIKFKYAYQCPEMEEPVFIHSGSVLRKTLPEWVVYQEVYEAGEGDDKKMIMRGITAIDPEWLPVYVPKLCNLGNKKFLIIFHLFQICSCPSLCYYCFFFHFELFNFVFILYLNN